MERRLFFGLFAATLAAVAMTPIMHTPAFATAGLDTGGIVGKADIYTWDHVKGWDLMGEISAPVAAIGEVHQSPFDRTFAYTLTLPGQPPVGMPASILAAMQPDNGAGSISGDRAQSVGKAGDLKAKRPEGVQSGSPGSRTVDARKTSWLTRRFLPVPS